LGSLIPDDPAVPVQFASDIDGDLHMFPRNIGEPDYEDRWRVWVLLADGSRTEAPLCSPLMCVTEGVVSNPFRSSGHERVAGWYVGLVGATGIEVAIENAAAVRIRHPWAKDT
jgi:hypothetical protein